MNSSVLPSGSLQNKALRPDELAVNEMLCSFNVFISRFISGSPIATCLSLPPCSGRLSIGSGFGSSSKCIC